mgnify:CR=1 FL=1
MIADFTDRHYFVPLNPKYLPHKIAPMESYDIVVIGSGPGGYVCAIRAAQLGFKTALIEKYNTLGGTCLNVGCIPSKALLDSSEHYFNAAHNFKEHGIGLEKLKVDMPQMIKRKSAVVEQTTKGIDFLMKKNKVTVYHGLGSFEDKNTVKIKKEDGEEKITGKYIVIATGSKPNYFPGMEPDKERIVTSTEALEFKKVPKSMVVIGGGVIGEDRIFGLDIQQHFRVLGLSLLFVLRVVERRCLIQAVCVLEFLRDVWGRMRRVERAESDDRCDHR